jgi:hypothetical protein
VSGWRSRGRREEELLGTLERVITPHRRPSLPVLAWELRKDIALGVGVAALFLAVVVTSGVVWAVIGLSVVAGALSPPWSARMRAFGWLLMTPHRLRAGLYHARIQNRNGKRPVITRITSEPFGERVRLWCPAGIAAEDIQAQKDVLRAACWASDVRVTRDEQRSHLVTVDVIRRPDDFEPCHNDPDTTPCLWP